MKNNLVDALNFISPDDYQGWIKVGMALKHEGLPLSVWENWSSASAKYKPGECEKKWRSFSDRQGMVTAGTIIRMAHSNGYEPLPKTYDWDDEIDASGIGHKTAVVQPVIKSSIPAMSGNPIDHLREFLSEMYESNEYVGYCDRLTLVNGKWTPKYGIKGRTAGELLKGLEKGFDGASINPESPGGALIRVNPMDGIGESDCDVTSFRYCVVESDVDSIEKQYHMLHKLNLPIKFLIHSGNKSLHAIVHIDAPTADVYRRRVAFMYDYCEKNGLMLDKNNRNPSRYTRMPGIKRGDSYQYIIESDVGPKDFKEWKSWTERQELKVPSAVKLSEILENIPPLKDELIEGILRVGHKMLISAPSKAGKSFLLMNLAICFAEGLKWLGHQCKQGRVLYINLELDEASCFHRFREIYRKLGIAPQNADLISILNLRGKAMPMDQLTSLLINDYKDSGYIAVIFDPIYKIIIGDENNATEMGEFCSYFDSAAVEVGAAMIYSHHHSKGAQNKYANSADRSSGSGVFARDPDSILDLVPLSIEGAEDAYRDTNDDASSSLSAWELSGTLREFPPLKTTRIWFDYPLHIVDEDGLLDEATYNESGRRGVGKNQRPRKDSMCIIKNIFDTETSDTCDAVSADYICNVLGLSLSSLKRFSTEKTLYELATLPNGEKVVLRRGQTMIRYKNASYTRPSSKNQRWILCETELIDPVRLS